MKAREAELLKENFATESGLRVNCIIIGNS